jgi:hypothetical protein
LATAGTNPSKLQRSHFASSLPSCRCTSAPWRTVQHVLSKRTLGLDRLRDYPELTVEHLGRERRMGRFYQRVIPQGRLKRLEELSVVGSFEFSHS